MEYFIGQKFEGKYPPQAAVWCNRNNAHIEKENGIYTIVENVPLSEVTREDIIKGYENAVQSHLDTVAQSRGYDNTYTCLSYIASTDETWKREAAAFNAWRDAVWRKCHKILDMVANDQMAVPTVEELITLLPVIDWNDPE